MVNRLAALVVLMTLATSCQASGDQRSWTLNGYVNSDLGLIAIWDRPGQYGEERQNVEFQAARLVMQSGGWSWIPLPIREQTADGMTVERSPDFIEFQGAIYPSVCDPNMEVLVEPGKSLARCMPITRFDARPLGMRAQALSVLEESLRIEGCTPIPLSEAVKNTSTKEVTPISFAYFRTEGMLFVVTGQEKTVYRSKGCGTLERLFDSVPVIKAALAHDFGEKTDSIEIMDAIGDSGLTKILFSWVAKANGLYEEKFGVFDPETHRLWLLPDSTHTVVGFFGADMTRVLVSVEEESLAKGRQMVLQLFEFDSAKETRLAVKAPTSR